MFCFVFRFGNVFVISASDLSILRMDLIHSHDVITAFALFVHMWYFNLHFGHYVRDGGDGCD